MVGVFWLFFFFFFFFLFFFFFKQKTAYEMCGRDWSSDVCSSDLSAADEAGLPIPAAQRNLRTARRTALQCHSVWCPGAAAAEDEPDSVSGRGCSVDRKSVV